MYHDKRGVAFTASSQEAVDAFDASVDEFLASGRDAARLLKRIGQVDPDMIMGQVLRGYFYRLPALPHLAAMSGESLEAAEKSIFFRKTSLQVALTGKTSKSERISIASRSFIF